MIEIIISLVIVLFSIVIHEVAHGSMAYYLGDPTAKELDRLSLNPLKHLDPFGSFILPFVLVLMGQPAIGWAKPVPIDFRNIRDPRWGAFKVAISGPAANFLIALIFGLVLRFIAVPEGVFYIFYLVVFYNLLLCFFNLIPIPPLDGSHILFTFIDNFEIKRFLSQYGFIILLVVIFLIPNGLSWLGSLIEFIAKTIIGY